jgi:hypothetical protein
VVLVVGFIVALYAVSTDVGRRHIRGGAWLVITILALLFVAHFAHYGPLDTPLLDSPIDLIVVVALSLASFRWSVRAGGPTEELAEILLAQERAQVPAVEEKTDVLAAH